MAEVIKIKKYRGVKIQTDDKIVIHATNMDNEKIHIHMKWLQLEAFLKDISKK
jgi:translation initiation factor IF-1